MDVITRTVMEGNTRYYIGGQEVSVAVLQQMERDGKIIAALEAIERHLANIAARMEK